MDTDRHQSPHIHARYQDSETVIDIPSGDVLEGSLPPSKLRMVVAWVEIHRDELMADWQLASSGQHPFRIEPLH